MAKNKIAKLLPGEPWKTSPESVDLDCALTEEELVRKAKVLSEKQRTLEAKEDAKTASAAEYTAVIKALKGEISVLSLQIGNERETRRVACEWQFGVPEKHQKTLVRHDTGDVVRIQDCEPFELQGNLFEGENEGADEDDQNLNAPLGLEEEEQP